MDAIICEKLDSPDGVAVEVDRVEVEVDRVEVEGVALLDLEPHHCRWPLGAITIDSPPATRFCGRRALPTSSYCPKCHRRAFEKKSNWKPPEKRGAYGFNVK